MADIKISQITAKSNNLASTDLFAIAESDGSGGFASKKITGAQLKDSTLNEQTVTTYNLVLTDAHKTVIITNGSAIDLKIPTNSGIAFPIGTRIEIIQGGAGQITVTPTSGVTVNSSGGKTKLAAQYAVATILKVATNTWYLFGDITT
tara:strand:+ start:565 stop:1008 length:444 start_codon:yes stop_codon:yes gene_type:complete